MDIERIEPEDVPILLRWQALAVIGQKVKALKDFEHGTDFGADDRSGWTGFETAGLLAVLANIGKKYPAKRVLAIVA